MEKEELNNEQDVCDLRQKIVVLERENKNLKFEVMHLKQQSNKKIESLEEIVKKLKALLKAIQGNEFDRINFLKEQLQKEQTHLSNILSHSLVNVVLVAVSAKTPTFTDMQKSIISTILLNSSSSYKHFSEREKDFWIDMYVNCSHRVFNRISENLNGPWRSTVQRWQVKTEKNVYNLSWLIFLS